MVTVGNKVDLVTEEQLVTSPCLPVSATLGFGLDHLARHELTPKLFSACHLKELTARYDIILLSLQSRRKGDGKRLNLL